MTVLVKHISGHECLFDKEDYLKYWHYGFSIGHDSAGFYYLQLNSRPYRSKRFSRVLLNAPPDLIVDHKDRNTLNNCKSNLRLATLSQSAANREVTWGDNIYQGVYKTRWNTYKVSISVEGKRIYLGCFPSEKFAAEVYRQAQLKYFGEFACMAKQP